MVKGFLELNRVLKIVSKTTLFFQIETNRFSVHNPNLQENLSIFT